jgi:peptide/nickel transport system substrate-binding protein
MKRVLCFALAMLLGVVLAQNRVLVAAATTEPPHLNPAITTAGPVHTVAGSIFNGLVGLDADANPVPELAERWEVRDNGKTYVFFLRQGVRWHDGQPFSSADVKFTFEEVLLKFHGRSRVLESALDRIETPDAHTVIFRFKHPYAPLLRRLDNIEAPIIPRHIFQGSDPLNNPANRRPVGTGPFQFGEWQRGQQVVLLRNPNYWRQGYPRLDRAVIRFIPSAPAAAAALERGEVDYLFGVGGAQLAHLRQVQAVRLERSPAGAGGSYCVSTLIPNLRNPHFRNPRVRQAFYHAINREFILERVHFNEGRVAHGPIASTLPFFDPSIPTHAFDPARANQLLDAAGFPRRAGGLRFQIRFTFAAATFGPLAEVLRDQLRQVGIDLVLEPLDFTAATDRVFIRKEFDLGVASLCGGPDPEIGVRRLLDSRNIGPIPFSNGSLYVNPLVDSLLDRAVQTLDEGRRTAIYRQLQQVVARDLPYFWLVETKGSRAWRTTVQGIQIWRSNPFENATVGGN